MDDQRLKRAGGGNYFEEVLSRIRDIRSSEKVFWRNVLEIFLGSILSRILFCLGSHLHAKTQRCEDAKSQSRSASVLVQH
jgi:hypothetical protein